jgi:hypothetical protein
MKFKKTERETPSKPKSNHLTSHNTKSIHLTNFLFIVSLIFSIYACNPVKNIDRKASRNEIKSLYPTQSFDSLAAKKMLTYGKATIKGVIYKKTNKLAIMGGKTYGSNVTIRLYPVTPYLLEWYDLREKKENKRTKVYISDLADRYRLDVTADKYGRFEFEKMRPGKYFIHAIMTTTQRYSRDVEVGTNSYGTRYYQKERYSVSKNHRLEQFIEIKNEKDVIEVVLK